jgi:pilus assembly protein CpaE
MISSTNTIFIVTPQSSVAAAIQSALSSNGQSWTLTKLPDLNQISFHLDHAAAPAVLVDIEDHPIETLRKLDPIIVRYPATRFIAVSSVIEQDVLIQAMQSGVRHVISKSRIAQELPELLKRFVTANAPAATVKGELIVVLSAGGGCGATTLSVNLANELAAQAGGKALMIDLDLAYAPMVAMLGVETKYGLDYILAQNGPIDAHLIGSAATQCTDQIHLLAEPQGDGLTTPGMPDLARLPQALDAARQAYPTVVVDAPRVPADMAAMLVNQSSRTLLAMQLTVKDTRTARAMLATLSGLGVSASRILPIISRYAKRQHMVSLDEVSLALGSSKIECIRNDYQTASRATDLGKTLAADAPRSVLRRDIQDLAAKISSIAAARPA